MTARSAIFRATRWAQWRRRSSWRRQGARCRTLTRAGRGDLTPLLGWLRTHVHGLGSLVGFNDLLVAATGKPLDPADFEAHLTARYLA